MIKRLLIFMILLAGIVAVPYAQTKNGVKSRAEKLKELRDFKIKFIAQEIDLKEDQKKQFVELYEKMDDERRQLFEQTRTLERKISKESNVSDEEYAKVSKAITEAREKDAEIEKKYDAQFGKFLSNKQIFLMKSAEEKFRQKMSEMRHKRAKK